jgi:hypothetical protein
MEISIADGRKLASMRSKTPPKAQAEVEKFYQSEHKKDADEIVQLSRQSTLVIKYFRNRRIPRNRYSFSSAPSTGRR